MIVRLAPRVRVPVAVTEVRCSRRHDIHISHLRGSVHERAFFVRCPHIYPDGDRCDAWCYLTPAGVGPEPFMGRRVDHRGQQVNQLDTRAWYELTDVTAEQVRQLRDSVFLPEYIASQVVLEYRRTLRRRAG